MNIKLSSKRNRIINGSEFLPLTCSPTGRSPHLPRRALPLLLLLAKHRSEVTSHRTKPKLTSKLVP